MLRLILMRHAEADSASRDFDRPLTPYGRSQATHAGKELLQKQIIPNAILHSAALRTSETARLVQDELCSSPLMSSNQGLYNSHPKTILDTINTTDNDIHCLLVVAHNPGISIITNQLCAENRYYAFHPSEWHVLDFDVDSWDQVCIATGAPQDYE